MVEGKLYQTWVGMRLRGKSLNGIQVAADFPGVSPETGVFVSFEETRIVVILE